MFELDSAFHFWLGFGLFLMFAEFIVPGLVVLFVGLGALTVAAFLHYNLIDNLAWQLIVWFISSTIYIFSLRLLVIRIYPSDTQKTDIDEDNALIGKTVEVIEVISPGKTGRFQYGESTWRAIGNDSDHFKVGENVVVVGRNNISWVVEKFQAEKINHEES